MLNKKLLNNLFESQTHLYSGDTLSINKKTISINNQPKNIDITKIIIDDINKDTKDILLNIQNGKTIRKITDNIFDIELLINLILELSNKSFIKYIIFNKWDFNKINDLFYTNKGCSITQYFKNISFIEIVADSNLSNNNNYSVSIIVSDKPIRSLVYSIDTIKIDIDADTIKIEYDNFNCKYDAFNIIIMNKLENRKSIISSII